MTSKNDILFERAQRSIPAGVNSPVRAFRSVGGTPRFFVSGSGSRVVDADGKAYVDYVGSWGPLVLGHAHPEVVRAVQQAAAQGLSFGAPTEAEIEMAEEIVKLVPSMEMVRLVSSKAGSGALTFGNPSSGGVPADFARHTLVLDYNDTQQLEDTFRRAGDSIAAVIVEPVAGNMNLIAPRPQFLQAMRELCTRHGAVLIFDEVMTGFRVALGGAQAHYGIQPDLTTLGKVIGGGMPVGAFGGRRDIMQKIAPLGPVYQAGTLSGNPVAMAAGLATLRLIQAPGFYDRLGAMTRRLTDGLAAAAREQGVTFSAQAVGGMFGLYFRTAAPETYGEVMECDKEAFNRFFHAMLVKGVYFAPSAFEAGFVSAAHTAADIDETVAVAAKIFEQLAG
ncbi:MAG: glutamate-semialdehyde -aminomutase [Proteobacteria bacterium]|nr:glutamate-semialdehyde -aminomutase [Pseudomonadota bacterium]